PARCSPGKCCWSRCGGTGTPRIPGWSTCMSSGCGPRSRKTRSAPRSWLRSGASDIRRDQADLRRGQPRAACPAVRRWVQRRQGMKGAATSDVGSAPRLPRLGALVPGALPNAARRLRRLARRRFAALRRRLARAHGVLRARWLRSLQLRVITTTLVISALVVTVLGFFLMQQISADQLKAKETQAASVVESGQISAEAAPGVNTRPNGRSTQDLMWSIVDELRANGAESDYGVAI